jgi:hypothetical protein
VATPFPLGSSLIEVISEGVACATVTVPIPRKRVAMITSAAAALCCKFFTENSLTIDERVVKDSLINYTY